MKKVLIFHYIPGAGGKFIINTLAYSGQVSAQDLTIARNFLKTKDYRSLTSSLLATVPPKEQGKTQWVNRELGCWQLWGKAIDDIKENKNTNLLLNDISDLVDSHIWLPVIAHSKESFVNLKKYFAQDRVFSVYIQPTADFLNCAVSKKWAEKTRYLHPKMLKVLLENEIIGLDHDFIFKDWDPRTTSDQINVLCQHLGITLDLSLAQEYIDRYINFHLD